MTKPEKFLHLCFFVFLFLHVFMWEAFIQKNFFMRDYLFSIFDIMLLHLKLQTCFVLPGLISTILNFQKFHSNWTNWNPWYIITYTEYDNSNVFFRNSENEEDLYQNFTCQGISYVSILIENSNVIIISFNIQQ